MAHSSRSVGLFSRATSRCHSKICERSKFPNASPRLPSSVEESRHLLGYPILGRKAASFSSATFLVSPVFHGTFERRFAYVWRKFSTSASAAALASGGKYFAT